MLRFERRPVGGGRHHECMSSPVPRPPKPGESLGDLRSHLVGEWDPDANGEFTAFDVKVSAAFWAGWVCSVVTCGYRWSAWVYSRSRGAGCPECKKRGISLRRSKPKPGQSLGDLYLDVARDWTPELNGGVTAFEVAAHAGIQATWRCAKCTHQWPATVGNRTRAGSSGRGCPDCFRRNHSVHMARVTDIAKSLAVAFPEVATEWDFEAAVNAGRSPETVMGKAGAEAGWVCAKGHRWVAKISNRTAYGTGCSDCSKGRESKQEVGMREFLANRLVVAAKGRVPRTDGGGKRPWLVDVLCPEDGIVVEFDGSWWHSEKANPGMSVKDARKADDIRSQGLRVVRVREAPLVVLHADDLVVPLGTTGGVIGALVWAHLVGLGVVEDRAA